MRGQGQGHGQGHGYGHDRHSDGDPDPDLHLHWKKIKRLWSGAGWQVNQGQTKSPDQLVSLIGSLPTGSTSFR